MTFNTRERSQQDGSPVELFLVVYGSEAAANFRFTDAPRALTVGGDVYEPVPVKRSSSKTNGNGTGGDITITVPITHPVADLFIGYPPSFPVAVLIRQGHMPEFPTLDQPDEDFIFAFAGIITDANRQDSEVTLTCKMPTSDLELPGIRRHYQRPCAHVLYGERCAASRNAARTVAEVVTVNTGSRIINFGSTDWQKANASPANYIGGYVTWETSRGTEFGSIIDATANTVKVIGSMREISAGTEVSIYLGCGYDLTSCLRLHDNVVNYGGQPWIPTINPVKTNAFR